MKVINFKNIEQVKQHILTKEPTLYCSSQTSLVIPFEKLDCSKSHGLDVLDKTQTIGNLAAIKANYRFIDQQILEVSGGTTWKEAKEFCREHGRQVMTSPTEELACVLAGVATSATGERCFGFGTIRDQVKKVWFINNKGEEICLDSSKTLSEFSNMKLDQDLLKKYQESYQKYSNFKNGPFPRLKKETDLMVGTEGQLGVITKVWLLTVPNENVIYLFLKLNKWEEDHRPHLEFFHKIQDYRGKILSCELMDENSLAFLKDEQRPVNGKDLFFIEILSEHFDDVYQNLISKFELISEDDFFEVSREECQKLRVSVPRAIFEDNDKRGVIKKASDVQALNEHFDQMFDYYKSWSKSGIPYNLFGHYGDGHLHFNFMPSKEDALQTDKLLGNLYLQVPKWQGSPFAEHGIGLIKKKFIKNFYSDLHLKMFRKLKTEFDKDNIFFPEGFLNL